MSQMMIFIFTLLMYSQLSRYRILQAAEMKRYAVSQICTVISVMLVRLNQVTSLQNP